MEDLWGFCRTCPFAEVCLGGCSFTAHALFGRPGNNPYCSFRARTLAAVGVESESELAFAGLHELLGPIGSHIARLPDLQRHALDAAFGVDVVLGRAQRAHDTATVGQGDMFGSGAAVRVELVLPTVEPWLPAERLRKE